MTDATSETAIEQSDLRCHIDGHERVESTFRLSGGQRLTVASCRQCKRKLGSWSHD